MAQAAREAAPQFSQPVGQVMTMLAVLILTGAGAVFALPRVLPVFQANPYLNGFILLVFVIGVLSCFWQVGQLISSVRWIESFVVKGQDHEKVPQLLAPLATLLRARGKQRQMQINATSTRSILDSVATRIDEVRDITRYIVNLLIFLGLLGTFYGLATTVPAVVETISNLAPKEGEGGEEVFNRLLVGLESQLGGVGVAFASSLLGLAGSLVVGLLELFVGRGQNRFYRELEEWLSTITRVGFASGEDGSGSAEAGVLAGVLDTMAEQMESLQMMLTQSDVSRAMVDEKLGVLADSVEKLTDRLTDTAPLHDALTRVADGQEQLLQHLSGRDGVGDGLDAESRMRLRSIDVQMLRILEEISAGRQESVSELRMDLNALSRAIGQLGASAGRPAVQPRPLRKSEREQGG